MGWPPNLQRTSPCGVQMQNSLRAHPVVPLSHDPRCTNHERRAFFYTELSLVLLGSRRGPARFHFQAALPQMPRASLYNALARMTTKDGQICIVLGALGTAARSAVLALARSIRANAKLANCSELRTYPHPCPLPGSPARAQGVLAAVAGVAGAARAWVSVRSETLRSMR